MKKGTKSKKKKIIKNTKKFNPNFKIFDRNQFNKDKNINININAENFNVGKIVKFDDIQKYNGIHGVWAKWGIDPDTGKKVCIDVSQCYDIGKEMDWTYKAIIKGKKSQHMTNDDIKNTPHRNANKYIKYRNVAKYLNIEFRLIKKNINTKIERENLELLYAHKYKSIMWYPCPGYQQKLLKKYMIPYLEYKEKYKL